MVASASFSLLHVVAVLAIGWARLEPGVWLRLRARPLRGCTDG